MSKYLKEQREKLGIQLNDFADITKIKASYLKAIEEEDFEKLPAEVYTKGYIREYAKFLKVSPYEAIMSYNAYLEKLKDEGKKPKENLYLISQSTLPKKSWKEYLHSKGFFRKLLLGFSLTIAATAVYLLTHSKSNVSLAPQKIVTDTQISTPVHDDENKISKKRHLLDIIATDKTWIRIVIDGVDKKEILLHAGEKVAYEANQSINMLIGNASGVKLIFNGKEFENLGNKGQVIRLSLPLYNNQ